MRPVPHLNSSCVEGHRLTPPCQVVLAVAVRRPQTRALALAFFEHQWRRRLRVRFCIWHGAPPSPPRRLPACTRLNLDLNSSCAEGHRLSPPCRVVLAVVGRGTPTRALALASFLSPAALTALASFGHQQHRRLEQHGGVVGPLRNCLRVCPRHLDLPLGVGAARDAP